MSGPDVLLATKLHVPRPQPGFVRRRRLLQALGEGLARGRVLVCAPAGFGKVMRQRAEPGTDLGAFAEELVRLFNLGIRR